MKKLKEVEKEISKAEIYESIKYLKELMYKAYNAKKQAEIDILISDIKEFIYSKEYLADAFESRCEEVEDFLNSYRAKKISILLINISKKINLECEIDKNLFRGGSNTNLFDILFHLMAPFVKNPVLSKDGKIDFFIHVGWAGFLYNCYLENSIPIIKDKIDYFATKELFEYGNGIFSLDFYLLENELITLFTEESLTSYMINIIFVCGELIHFLYSILGIEKNYELSQYINNFNLEYKGLSEDINLEDILSEAEFEAVKTNAQTTNQRKTAEKLTKSLVTIQTQLKSARKKVEIKLGYKISTRELTRLLK